MELRGKKVVVVGLGRTGESVADFLLEHGARVTISEKRTAGEMGPAVEAWRSRGAVVECGGHDPAAFLAADLIVPSPGVPKLPAVQAAREKGVPVLAEIELAYRFLRGSLIGITGTNGKSTTATLTHKILAEGGRKAFLTGNIGVPLLSFVRDSRPDHLYVIEISSFQLEYIERFKVHIAVLLNVSQNHLDWHGSFEEYWDAKKKLVERLGRDDWAVLNRDDARVWALAGSGPFGTLGFSRTGTVERGACVVGSTIVLRDGAAPEEPLLPLGEIPLFGAHNRDNVMAAALVGRLLGVPAESMRRSIGGFHGLEHRLEPVRTVRGVEFVNDSKATTVDAASKAVESFDRPIVLILGGKDKGSDFRPLRGVLAGRVKTVVLVGSAKDKIRAALEGTVPLLEARDYAEVVDLAFGAAAPGDVVVLAPACTSWDMFKSFEERGETFKREVGRLAEAVAGRGR
jgi:UDP-N-acetylmuramoylalanine--D-glutamate ligase